MGVEFGKALQAEGDSALNTSFNLSEGFRKAVAVAVLSASALFAGCAKSIEEVSVDLKSLPAPSVAAVMANPGEFEGGRVLIEGQATLSRDLSYRTQPTARYAGGRGVVMPGHEVTAIWYSVADPLNPSLKLPVFSDKKLEGNVQSVSGVITTGDNGFPYLKLEHYTYLKPAVPAVPEVSVTK